MNTKVKESKGITIEGISKVRGKNVYVDNKKGTLESVSIKLSSITDKIYWGTAMVSNKSYQNQKWTWILNRGDRTLSIYKGKRQTPCYSHSLTLWDLKTPQSLRNLIGDGVWNDWETNGKSHSLPTAPFNPF